MVVLGRSLQKKAVEVEETCSADKEHSASCLQRQHKLPQHLVCWRTGRAVERNFGGGENKLSSLEKNALNSEGFLLFVFFFGEGLST